MKTIIHYTNGKSYEYPNATVDCWVDWDMMVLSLIDADSEPLDPVFLTEDTLYVEVRDIECNHYAVWINPEYKVSVKMDVMTANSRAKANRVSPDMKAYWEGVKDGIKFKEVEIGEKALFSFT